MAIPCLHKSITRSALEAAGFNEASRDRAAEANAEVDEKQGNSASQANLHAMCGYVQSLDPLGLPVSELQNDTECRAAVKTLIDEARADIVHSLTEERNFNVALKRLGQILHTIQDRAFHNFEPWPHAGIADAFKNDFNYMTCHAIRDLGAISRLNLTQIHRGRFDIEITQRVGRDVFLSARAFADLGRNQSPGPEGRDFAGTGGMLTITFGAAPGSVKLPESRGSLQEPPVWSLAMNGPAARTRAEDDSAEFVESTKKEVLKTRDGQTRWTKFLESAPSRN